MNIKAYGISNVIGVVVDRGESGFVLLEFESAGIVVF